MVEKTDKTKKTEKSRVPVQKRAKETRAKIIAAARQMFSDKGYHGTNSKQIARAAGVATGTFYMYFKDKKPLFLEVFRSIHQEIAATIFNEDLMQLAKLSDKRQLTHILVEKLYEAHRIAPKFHGEVMSLVYADEEVRAAHEEEEAKVLALLDLLFQGIQNDLRVADRAAAARVVLRAADEVIHGINIFQPQIEEKRLLSELEDMIFLYLFAENQADRDKAIR